ncbi:glycosyltransferase family 2 protein [Sabulilitoribacter arenilitoris]|uniref:Glycosyltransferase family 2 protein n=1 Tax=Wocania arenilitoris TaxID=2044858 RepID=A0AAE3JM55_9FLAO|nr:glycosyltransferase family A protein [Wocania arenilitoris]MCF7568957.1 glycosyltransferase family 2 protein [Wocania arenilitoris]
MRKGNNPSNEEKVENGGGFHRAIIPVCIPHEKDYFKDAFEIFTYCLFSLKKTSSSNIGISVISNGSSDSINEKLLTLYKANHFDELIIERKGIGKINSILKALRTAEEQLITITDADVLFDNGWEDAVIQVFKNFPKAGAVCPVPVFRKQFQLTSNIWFRFLFSKKLKFSPVVNPEAMTQFAKSIGWPWLDKKYKDVIATLELKKDKIAVVGCSHFVATYKREVFLEMPNINSDFKIRGNSELLYTDQPVLKRGGYRLSTYDNYAYHMGNVLEDWIVDKFKILKDSIKNDQNLKLKELKKPYINPLFIDKIFKFLISINIFKRSVLKNKGLTKKQIKNFLS